METAMTHFNIPVLVALAIVGTAPSSWAKDKVLVSLFKAFNGEFRNRRKPW
jgi:hypothetical protein